MAKGKRGKVPEEERCRGTSRQSGERCKRRRSPGSEYCIFHGGRAPKGGAHPNFKDGRRSKYMPPPTLLKDYERGLNDPRLTHHREAVALLDAMIQQSLDISEEGGTAELWRKLKASWRRVKKARVAGDTPELGRALDEVGLLIERGAGQVDRDARVLKLLTQRRKQATAETERRLAEDRTFTHAQAAAFYRALGAVVRKHVEDPQVLRAISNDMATIGGRTVRQLSASSDAE